MRAAQYLDPLRMRLAAQAHKGQRCDVSVAARVFRCRRKPAGQVSHSYGDDKKDYEHNPVVEFMNMKREVRRYKKEVPQSSA